MTGWEAQYSYLIVIMTAFPLGLMVSLTERKARPSYYNVSQDLIHLTDSEKAKSGGDVVSSSGTGSISAGEENEGRSLSSADSSEYQPDEDDAMANADYIAHQELHEEDNISEADELNPQPHTPNEEASVIPSREVKLNLPQSVSVQPRRSAAATIPQINGIKLPAPYRALIKESATRLTVPRGGLLEDGRERLRNFQKARLVGSNEYPFGPVTPFGTRLKAPPPRRGRLEVMVVNEPDDPEERRLKRQKRAYNVARFVPLLAPWQVWEGEGWWPEMLAGHAATGPEKSKGKEKEKEEESERADWEMRENVRIGLDDVGRSSLDSLKILNEA